MHLGKANVTVSFNERKEQNMAKAIYKTIYNYLRRAQRHCLYSGDPEIIRDGTIAEGMIMQWKRIMDNEVTENKTPPETPPQI